MQQKFPKFVFANYYGFNFQQGIEASRLTFNVCDVLLIDYSNCIDLGNIICLQTVQKFTCANRNLIIYTGLPKGNELFEDIIDGMSVKSVNQLLYEFERFTKDG